MSYESDVIRDFLAHMGVAAEVRADENGHDLIVIETAEYWRQRGRIESWFTLIDQDEQHCYFRQRPRGTGTTLT